MFMSSGLKSLLEGGLKKGQLNVICGSSSVSVTKIKTYNFDSLNSLPCKYGKIAYSYNSNDSHYTLKYGNYEVDVDYEKDYIDGYLLKVALYKNGVMVSYNSDVCNDLPHGIVESCERIIDNFL